MHFTRRLERNMSTKNKVIPAIQKASKDNLDDLVGLFDGYRTFYKQPSNVVAAKKFLSERFKKDDSIIFLAYNKTNKPIGFTQLYPSFSSVSMKRMWILNDLFVDPKHRGQSVGRALMKKAEDFARISDSKGLVLHTAKDNTVGKALYESEGYKLDMEFDTYSLTF